LPLSLSERKKNISAAGVRWHAAGGACRPWLLIHTPSTYRHSAQEFRAPSERGLSDLHCTRAVRPPSWLVVSVGKGVFHPFFRSSFGSSSLCCGTRMGQERVCAKSPRAVGLRRSARCA